MNYVFFGNPYRAAVVLEKLCDQGLPPLATVTAPDRPIGRKRTLTPTAVKLVASANNLPTHLANTKSELRELIPTLKSYQPDFFIVVAYGVIMPPEIISIPTYDTLNLHYSLLPQWRGASPVVQQILNDNQTVGYSIMKMVEQLDAGGIYHQESWPMPDPTPTTEDLATAMSHNCARILPDITNKIISGHLLPNPQDEQEATYCYKIQKTDSLVDIKNDSQRSIYLKTKAYYPWPKAHFFTNRNDVEYRVVINETDWVDDSLVIKSVTPSGKKPMTWQEFSHWLGHDLLLA